VREKARERVCENACVCVRVCVCEGIYTYVYTRICIYIHTIYIYILKYICSLAQEWRRLLSCLPRVRHMHVSVRVYVYVCVRERK